MVKVTKIAAWKIGNEFFEDMARATTEVRRLVIIEMLEEEGPGMEGITPEDIASWIAGSFDKIEARVKAAMAGA